MERRGGEEQHPIKRAWAMAPSPCAQRLLQIRGLKLSGKRRIRVLEMVCFVHYEQWGTPASLSQQVLPQCFLNLPKGIAGSIQSFGDACIAAARGARTRCPLRRKRPEGGWDSRSQYGTMSFAKRSPVAAFHTLRSVPPAKNSRRPSAENATKSIGDSECLAVHPLSVIVSGYLSLPDCNSKTLPAFPGNGPAHAILFPSGDMAPTLHFSTWPIICPEGKPHTVKPFRPAANSSFSLLRLTVVRSGSERNFVSSRGSGRSQN